MNITAALVNELPLIALVQFAGLATFAALAFWALDFLRLTNIGKDRA